MCLVAERAYKCIDPYPTIWVKVSVNLVGKPEKPDRMHKTHNPKVVLHKDDH